MPSRFIREGWNDSERIRNAGEPAEVLLLRLILVADDYARFDGRLSVIRNRCWPSEDDEKVSPRPSLPEVATRLQALAAQHLVVQYEVGGKPYLYIPNFQQRTRAVKSKCPDPPANAGQVTDKGPTDGGQVSGNWRTPDGHVPDARPTHDGGPQAVSVSVSVPVSTNKNISTGESKPPPVDKSPHEVQGATRSHPAPDKGAAVRTKAIIEESRKAAEKASPPPDDLMARYRKTTRQPGDDETESPTTAPAKAPNGHLPPDWATTTDTIDQAGTHLGMQRLKYEPDDDYVHRINARLSLG